MRILFLFLLLLCGCSKQSFDTNNMNLQEVIQNTQYYIQKQQLQDVQYSTPLTSTQIEELFHMDLRYIKQHYVIQSIIPTQMHTIAIFETEKNLVPYVQKYIQTQIKMYDYFISNISDIMHQFTIKQNGNYLYFILGKNHQKVANYIEQEYNR